jgi:signal transduction histidine kinase/DNA-binding response OmpR family regulator/ligand-binding sensor domain-containing protein
MTIEQTTIPLRLIKWLFRFLIVAACFPVYTGNSQSMRTISTKDGLPQSFVSGIVQDDSSFIWIGTRGGLVRFDGVQYKLFQHDDGDSNSLATGFIIWMRRDHDNKIWIEHESGVIDEMDPVSEKIIHFLKGSKENSTNSDIQFIRRGWMVDSDHMFWGIIKGGGINTFDTKTKKLNHYNRANSNFPVDTIRGISETKKKQVWVVSDQWISLYNKQSGQFTHWSLPYTSDYGVFPNSDAIAIDLHERKNGELIWGDRQHLYIFNPENHSFKRVILPYTSFLGVRWIRTGPEGSDYFENYGRIFSYNDSSGLKPIGESIAEDFGDIKSFLVDRSGTIWLGMNAEGIKQIDPGLPYFKSFVYKKDFATDMLQQEFGINLMPAFNWKPEDNLFSSPSYQIRWTYDSHSRLYFCLKNTVLFFDSTFKKFTQLISLPEGNRTTGITVLQDEKPLVVCTNGNMFEYDFPNRKWNRFLDSSLLKKFNAAISPLDLFSDGKNLWITTTEDGLLKIDIHSKEIRQIKKSPENSLFANQLLGIRPDPTRSNLLWIGTFQGLMCFDKNESRTELFSVKDGLPDNTIYSILTDQHGNLWLGTNKGICRFDPITHQVNIFRSQHGLPGDEFNRFHQMLLPDGCLVFGGTDGWAIFDPLMIRKDVFEPVVALTDLKINNKEIAESEKNSILKYPLNAVTTLTLPYDQNTITIGFAGLEFSQPQQLQYRYRLVGYDNDWVNAGNNHQASYTKIPSGKYTLEVNASNTSGEWSSHIKTIQFDIKPPWWATSLAYLCYAIILTGMIWTFIRFRVSRTLMRREVELKEKETSKLKELDELKSRFFSNITHEFRTPLTLILGPAEQIKTANPNDQQQVRLADVIVQNSRQLLTLVNRLLDLSKIEAKALKLSEQRGNPGTFVGLVVNSFEMDAKSKRIQLSFDDQTGHMDCWFYSDALERIVYNLVSNALKFTPAEGQVTITLSAFEQQLVLVVKDNGVGIPENKVPHIFERFYQAGNHSKPGDDGWQLSTGIGLSLVKELVSQMNAEIEVESKTGSGSGTIFTLTMPYREIETTQPAIIPDTDQGNGVEQPISSLKAAQILLVEDNPDLADFIISILSGQYEVSHALNGSLGLEQTIESMPDLVISDIMMPVMDGLEMTRRVKADIRTNHIPIILLTAKASQENVIAGLTEGANDYLVKPFHPAELLLRIHNLLDAQQKLRERIRQELSRPEGFIEETPRPQHIFLTKLYELLDEHLDDDSFGVDQLAELLHMSRSSLHRKLKNLTDLSTSEVVRNFRLSRSTEYLKQGFNSSDAAYKSGFGSPAYFTKCFREVYGLTPGEWIRKVKA